MKTIEISEEEFKKEWALICVGTRTFLGRVLNLEELAANPEPEEGDFPDLDQGPITLQPAYQIVDSFDQEGNLRRVALPALFLMGASPLNLREPDAWEWCGEMVAGDQKNILTLVAVAEKAREVHRAAVAGIHLA